MLSALTEDAIMRQLSAAAKELVEEQTASELDTQQVPSVHEEDERPTRRSKSPSSVEYGIMSSLLFSSGLEETQKRKASRSPDPAPKKSRLDSPPASPEVKTRELKVLYFSIILFFRLSWTRRRNSYLVLFLKEVLSPSVHTNLGRRRRSFQEAVNLLVKRSGQKVGRRAKRRKNLNQKKVLFNLELHYCR